MVSVRRILLLSVSIAIATELDNDKTVCDASTNSCNDDYVETEREALRRSSDKELSEIMKVAHASLEFGWVLVTMHVMQQAGRTAGFHLLGFDTGFYPPNITIYDEEMENGGPRAVAGNKDVAILLSQFWFDWFTREQNLGQRYNPKFGEAVRAENREQYAKEVHLFHMWAKAYPNVQDKSLQLFYSEILVNIGDMLRAWRVAHEALLAYPNDHRLSMQELRFRPFGNPFVRHAETKGKQFVLNAYGTEHTGPESKDKSLPVLGNECWLNQKLGRPKYTANIACCLMPIQSGDWFLHGEGHRKFWMWESSVEFQKDTSSVIAELKGPNKTSSGPQRSWRNIRVAVLYYGKASDVERTWSHHKTHVVQSLRSEGATVIVYGSLRSSRSSILDNHALASLATENEDANTQDNQFHIASEAANEKGDLIAAGLSLIFGSRPKSEPPVGGRHWSGFGARIPGVSMNMTYSRGSDNREAAWGESSAQNFDYILVAALNVIPKTSVTTWPIDMSKLNLPFRIVDKKSPDLCTCLVASSFFSFPPNMANRVFRGCGSGNPDCFNLGGTFLDVHIWAGGSSCYSDGASSKQEALENPFYTSYGKL